MITTSLGRLRSTSERRAPHLIDGRACDQSAARKEPRPANRRPAVDGGESASGSPARGSWTRSNTVLASAEIVGS